MRIIRNNNQEETGHIGDLKSKKKSAALNPNYLPLDEERLKAMKGFENLAGPALAETVSSIRQMALILYEVIRNSQPVKNIIIDNQLVVNLHQEEAKIITLTRKSKNIAA